MADKEAEDDTRRQPAESAQTVALWLLGYLESDPPRLVSEVRQAAKQKGIPPRVLRTVNRSLPIIRKPREIRGPWTWRLPQPDELVRVRYTCPVVDCQNVIEGWMEFGMSRVLFSAGLVRYLTKGTALRTQPKESESAFVRMKGSGMIG